MKPTLKVSRLEKVTREKYIELYGILKEIRKLSTRENRALVSDIPGTTRDTVEEYLNIDVLINNIIIYFMNIIRIYINI